MNIEYGQIMIVIIMPELVNWLKGKFARKACNNYCAGIRLRFSL